MSNYVMEELGAISETTWCSVKFPKAGCTALAGIVKPMTVGTLEMFKALQRACNRILVKQGVKPIDVDGRIGPGTVRAVNVVIGSDPGTIDDVAHAADDLIATITARAAAIGAPVVADPVPKSPPSMPASGGGVAQPPDNAIKLGLVDQVTAQLQKFGVSPPLAVGALVVVGAVIYKLRGKPGAKRKSKRR